MAQWITLGVYIACFGIGTISHATDYWVLGVVIMASDVAVNSYALFVLGIEGFAVALPLQAAFLGFVLGSIGFLWPPRS